MELKILAADGKEAGKVKLPAQFDEPVRADLIKKAVQIIQANRRQRYGAKVGAGMRASANLSRRRHKYRGSYGFGISRVPRKILSRRGTRFNWVGAVAPGTVGGRRAHPPKATKSWSQKINKKENRKAIRSAMAATVVADIVKSRGHAVPENYPFVADSKIEQIAKAKDAKAALVKLGMADDLKRSAIKTVRAGRGKSRGRKYKTRKGPLVVVSEDCPLSKSCSSIPGVDVVNVKSVNAELLAPGTNIGRLTIFTNKAVEMLDKEKIFM